MQKWKSIFQLNHSRWQEPTNALITLAKSPEPCSQFKKDIKFNNENKEQTNFIEASFIDLLKYHEIQKKVINILNQQSITS